MSTTKTPEKYLIVSYNTANPAEANPLSDVDLTIGVDHDLNLKLEKSLSEIAKKGGQSNGKLQYRIVNASTVTGSRSSMVYLLHIAYWFEI